MDSVQIHHLITKSKYFLGILKIQNMQKDQIMENQNLYLYQILKFIKKIFTYIKIYQYKMIQIEVQKKKKRIQMMMV